MRFVTATMLALSLMAVPVVSDWCGISCEAAHTRRSQTASVCHHVNSTTPLVASVPVPCGQNHQPVIVASAATPAAASRAVVAMSPVAKVGCGGSSGTVIATIFHHEAVPSPPFPLVLATVLRV
jgi:hypothetical protein